MKIKTTLGFNPLKMFKKHHPINSFLSVALALSVINLSTSCYYKITDLTTSQEEINERIATFKSFGHYTIIQSGENLFHLNNIKIDQENNMLYGTMENLSPSHEYKKPRKKNSNRFNKNKQNPTNEFHIKLKTNITLEVGKEVSIPFEDIHSISLNKRDSGTELAVVMLGAYSFIGTIYLILLLTKSSCPFVYVKSGDTYQFIGELYPGVLTENMQRDDYIPLGKYDDSNNDYSIKVTNELKEIQYTDLLELIVVDHPSDIQVLLDDQGNMYTFTNLIQPIHVLIDDLELDKETVFEKDNNFYAFNNTTEWDDNKRHIIIEFDAPEDPADAKLYLTAKNSMWLDYIFGKFNEQFGSYYQEFQVQQQTKTKEQSEKWIREQYIPLSVFVETSNGWQLIDEINTVGPLAFRDLVVPIDINLITQDRLRVKLETGFMFWEVDYVGIDYSENLPLSVNHISPYEAIDHNNNLVTKLITSEDNIYLAQPEVGDEVIVNFNLENASDNDTHSIFLKNRGYYNYVREYEGEPNLEALRMFKRKGKFPDFSKSEYYVLMGITDEEFVVLNK
ncbi:hypothetical protein [Aestuariivivens marinum]|uniref:hypothetical protein n=1 Tax=Aestuariivivens marinum TaxID=2913555 RepID=UPI001F5AF7F8|nr:hypothetical protein [Aestuariivivens marinum]